MAETTYTPDNIFAGVEQTNPKEIIIKSGVGVVARGTLLIALTADSGKYTIAKSDTDPVPTAAEKLTLVIAAEDTDSTSGDVETIGYRSGQFDENYLNFGTDTADTWRDDARNVNLIFNDGAANAL